MGFLTQAPKPSPPSGRNEDSLSERHVLQCRPIVTYYKRNLPHWHPPAQVLFLTWRLKGSLPAHLRDIAPKDLPGKRFVELDRALDHAATGPLWLKEPRVANCVVAALRKADDNHLIQLHAYTVMANHVHVLIIPIEPPSKTTRL